METARGPSRTKSLSSQSPPSNGSRCPSLVALAYNGRDTNVTLPIQTRCSQLEAPEEAAYR